MPKLLLLLLVLQLLCIMKLHSAGTYLLMELLPTNISLRQDGLLPDLSVRNTGQKSIFNATLFGGGSANIPPPEEKYICAPVPPRRGARGTHTDFSLRVLPAKLAKQLHFNSTLEPDGTSVPRTLYFLGATQQARVVILESPDR